MMRQQPVAATVIVAMLVATYVSTHSLTAASAPQSPAFGNVPVTLASWSGVAAPPLDTETRAALGADQYLHRYYVGPGGTIEMDVAYYARPQVGSSMHSPLNCLPGNGWEVSDVAHVPVVVGSRTWVVKQMTARRGGARFAMAYWFQGRDRVLSNEVSMRLHLLGDIVRGQPLDTSLVRLMLPSEGNDAAERGALTAFATQLIPALARPSR